MDIGALYIDVAVKDRCSFEDKSPVEAKEVRCFRLRNLCCLIEFFAYSIARKVDQADLQRC